MFAQLQCVDETGVLDISHSIISLDLEGSSNSSSHCLLLNMVLHHYLVDTLGSGSLPQLDVRHHQMLLIGVHQHVSEVFLEFESQQEPSSNLLNLNDFVPSFVEVDLDVITGAISSIKTLDQNAGRVSFKDSSESVDVYL